MSWTIINVAEVAAQPWRNGGGVTRELLAWPTLAAWTVRLSVADIAADGPFSAYPGIDRWFAVLSGAGVALGDPPRSLSANGEVFAFAGELAPPCRLLQGATRDLNLMLRRDAMRGDMRALRGPLNRLDDGGALGRANCDGLAVFSVRGGTLLGPTDEALALPPMALAWCERPAEGWHFRATAPGGGDFAMTWRGVPQGGV